MTFPRAAPKKMVSKALPRKNIPSQKEIHTGFWTRERSSTATPRTIKSQRTMIKGK